jgi:hypothetical protein
MHVGYTSSKERRFNATAGVMVLVPSTTMSRF